MITLAVVGTGSALVGDLDGAKEPSLDIETLIGPGEVDFRLGSADLVVGDGEADWESASTTCTNSARTATRVHRLNRVYWTTGVRMWKQPKK